MPFKKADFIWRLKMKKSILFLLSLIFTSTSVLSSEPNKCLLYLDGFEELLDRNQIEMLKEKYDLTVDITDPFKQRIAYENTTKDFKRSFADCMSQDTRDNTVIGCTSNILVVNEDDELKAIGVGKDKDTTRVLGSIPVVDYIWERTLAKRTLSKAINNLKSCK